MADVRNLGKNNGKNKVYVRDLGVNHVKNFLRKNQGTNLGKTLFVWEEVWEKTWRQHLMETNLGRSQGNIILRFIS